MKNTIESQQQEEGNRSSSSSIIFSSDELNNSTFDSATAATTTKGSALYDHELSLDNVRTLVFITKTKNVIKTITNNEINIHKRSRNATRVRITNQSLIGRITLDATDIDERGKNSLRYKVIKYLIRNPTNVDNFNKQILENTLNPLQTKLVYSIVSDKLLQLLSEDILLRIENTFETVPNNSKKESIKLFRTFYFGNPGEYVNINFDTNGLVGPIQSVSVNGESLVLSSDISRSLTKLTIPLRLPPPSQNPYYERKTIEITLLGEHYQTTVYLISADMNKILTNLIRMELVGVNGVRRDHSESLLSCRPNWIIDEYGTFRYYYDYFLEWSSSSSPSAGGSGGDNSSGSGIGGEITESLFDFMLQTNAFYIPLGYYAANYTHSPCYTFIIKAMIDLFTYFNEQLGLKNPIINFVRE